MVKRLDLHSVLALPLQCGGPRVHAAYGSGVRQGGNVLGLEDAVPYLLLRVVLDLLLALHLLRNGLRPPPKPIKLWTRVRRGYSRTLTS